MSFIFRGIKILFIYIIISFIITGTRYQLEKVSIDHVLFGSAAITPSTELLNLGVWFDSESIHVKSHFKELFICILPPIQYEKNKEVPLL